MVYNQDNVISVGWQRHLPDVLCSGGQPQVVVIAVVPPRERADYASVALRAQHRCHPCQVARGHRNVIIHRHDNVRQNAIP
jgi:hypothetical protein